MVAEHEPFVHEAPEPQQEEYEPQEPERHGRREVTRRRDDDDDGIGGLLAIGGAVAGLVLLQLFEGKK